MRADVTGIVHKVSGPLCSRCRNIPRTFVPDEFIDNDVLVEPAPVYYYPTGNYELRVTRPGVSETVKL